MDKLLEGVKASVQISYANNTVTDERAKKLLAVTLKNLATRYSAVSNTTLHNKSQTILSSNNEDEILRSVGFLIGQMESMSVLDDIFK